MKPSNFRRLEVNEVFFFTLLEDDFGIDVTKSQELVVDLGESKVPIFSFYRKNGKLAGFFLICLF